MLICAAAEYKIGWQYWPESTAFALSWGDKTAIRGIHFHVTTRKGANCGRQQVILW